MALTSKAPTGLATRPPDRRPPERAADRLPARPPGLRTRIPRESGRLRQRFPPNLVRAPTSLRSRRRSRSPLSEKPTPEPVPLAGWSRSFLGRTAVGAGRLLASHRALRKPLSELVQLSRKPRSSRSPSRGNRCWSRPLSQGSRCRSRAYLEDTVVTTCRLPSRANRCRSWHLQRGIVGANPRSS